MTLAAVVSTWTSRAYRCENNWPTDTSKIGNKLFSVTENLYLILTWAVFTLKMAATHKEILFSWLLDRLIQNVQFFLTDGSVQFMETFLRLLSNSLDSCIWPPRLDNLRPKHRSGNTTKLLTHACGNMWPGTKIDRIYSVSHWWMCMTLTYINPQSYFSLAFV